MISMKTGLTEFTGLGSGLNPVHPVKDLRALVAPTLQALKRMELNKWHRLIAMDIVDGTLSLGRQWMVVRQQRELGGLRRELSEGDLSRVLNGYEQVVNGKVERFAGLIELGLIAKRELAEGLLIVFNPDWKSWGCREMHQGDDRAAWRGAVDAQAREYDRQSVFGEVEERFSLAALLSDEQVEAALALARGDVVTAAGGGPGIERQERAIVGRPSCAGDAPERRPERAAARSGGGVTWENPKCIPEQIRGDLGKSQVPTIQVGKKFGKGIGKAIQSGILQIGQVDSRKRMERLKAALHGDERAFMWTVREVIGQCRDGMRWRLRHREGGPHRDMARRVFADILASERATTGTPASRAEDTWQRFGGRKLDEDRFQKKSRNLLNTQH